MDKPISVFEMYNRALAAFTQGPTCMHSILFDFTNDLNRVTCGVTAEEKQMAVFIANVAFFNAFCCERNTEVKETNGDMPDNIRGAVQDFLIKQGVLKRDEIRPFHDWAGEDPTKTGLRVLLRASLVVFEDYSGRVLYIQDH